MAPAAAEVVYSIRVVGIDSVNDTDVLTPWIPQTEVRNAPDVDAQTALLDLLDSNGFGYALIDYTQYGMGLFLDSIVKPDGTSLGSSGTGYWEFVINGQSSMVGANSYLPLQGDRLEWRYSVFSGNAPIDNEIETNPDAARPDYDAIAGDYTQGRVVDVAAPTVQDETELAFKHNYVGDEAWSYVSDPLLVNGNIYLAFKQSLRVISGKDGSTLAETELAAPIDYACRPVYTAGLVIVPLANGRLQAFTADTLICVWASDAVPDDPVNGPHQSLTTLIESDGYLYAGTAVASWTETFSGVYQSINALTGAVRWRNVNTASGYYWSGAAQAGSLLFIADDRGRVSALDVQTGTELDHVTLGASVRSTLVVYNGCLYAVDVSGRLNRIALNTTASNNTGPVFGAVDSLRFATGSTSMPTISNGLLFVGGAQADFTGVLAVIALDDFTIRHQIAAPAEVKSAPLITQNGTSTYVYFTYNTTPGGVMAYRLGDAAATDLYVPTGSDENWCVSSVLAGADGTLYYTNDSGNLYALKAIPPLDDEEEEVGDDGEDDGKTVNTGSTTDNQARNTKNIIPAAHPARPAPIAPAKPADPVTDAPATAEATTPPPAASSDTAASIVETTSPATDATPTQPQRTDTLPVLPLVGALVGALGLVGCIVWFLTGRKGRVNAP
jgi:hypothetical protein